MRRGMVLLIVAGLELAGRAGAARAAECADAEARLAFVRARLQADASKGRVWAWSWGLAYGAITVGHVALALTRDDPGERGELLVGAGKTVLGLVPVLLQPVPARRDAPRLDRALADGSGRCALVADAETMLARSARDEAFARGWLAHALTVAVNGGGFLIVGLAWDRWATGALGALVGVAVGELQILTRPTGSLRGWRDYRARWTVAPLVGPEAVGLTLSGAF